MNAQQQGPTGSGSNFGEQLATLAQSFVTYVRSRSPEHWLFFAVGVIVGLWLG